MDSPARASIWMLPQNHCRKIAKQKEKKKKSSKTWYSELCYFLSTLTITVLRETTRTRLEKGGLVWGYNSSTSHQLIHLLEGRINYWATSLKTQTDRERERRLRFNLKGIFIRRSFGILFRTEKIPLLSPSEKNLRVYQLLWSVTMSCITRQTSLSAEVTLKWTQKTKLTSCLTTKSFLAGGNGSSFTEFSSTTMWVHLSSPTSW